MYTLQWLNLYNIGCQSSRLSQTHTHLPAEIAVVHVLYMNCTYTCTCTCTCAVCLELRILIMQKAQFRLLWWRNVHVAMITPQNVVACRSLLDLWLRMRSTKRRCLGCNPTWFVVLLIWVFEVIKQWHNLLLLSVWSGVADCSCGSFCCLALLSTVV